MATVGDIKIRIGASIDPLLKSLRKAERNMQRSGRKLAELGNNMTVAVSLPVIAVGAQAIKAAAKIESLEKALESALGSAGAAADEMKRLEEAAKLPGLGFEQAIRGSVKLQAVGFSAEEAREALLSFGNAIALAGGAASDLDGVALALTQIASKGKISAEEINQLAERVPQVRKAIQNVFGTSDSEQLQKLGLDMKDFVNSVVTELNKLPKAQNTIKNSIENAGIAITKAFADIGKDINDTFDVQGKIESFSIIVGKAAKVFTSLSPELKKATLGFVGFAVVVGPVAKLLGSVKLAAAAAIGNVGTLVKGVRTATTAFIAMNTAQKLLLTGGIIGGIFLAVEAFQALQFQLDKAVLGSAKLAEINREVAQAAGAETRKVNELFGALKKETTAKDEKKRVVGELLQQYPDYFKGIDLEKSNLGELNDLQKKLNKSILEGVAARKKAEALDEIYAQILEKQLELQRVQKGGFDSLSFEERQNQDISGGLFGLGELVGVEGLRRAGESGQDFAVRSKIEGLQSELQELEKTANQTTQAFDQLFNTGTRRRSGRGVSLNFQEEESTSTPSTTTNFSTQITQTKKEIQGLQSVTDELQQQFTLIDNQAKLLGGTFGDVVAQKTNLLKDKIKELLEEGFTPASPEIQKLVTELKMLGENAPITPLENTKKAIAQLSSETVKTTDSVVMLGASISINASAPISSFKDRIEGTKESLKTLRAEGFAPTSEAVKELKKELSELQALNFGEEFSKELSPILEGGLANGLIGVAGALGDIAAGTAGFGSAAAAALGGLASILEQVGKLAITTGIAVEGIKKALKLHPVAAVVGGVALVALAKVVKAKAASLVPALAEGGIAYGPTLAMVGDNPGANINPEVIAPLDKLQKMMQPATGTREIIISGKLTADGRDLGIIIDRNNVIQRRTRGY